MTGMIKTQIDRKGIDERGTRRQGRGEKREGKGAWEEAKVPVKRMV